MKRSILALVLMMSVSLSDAQTQNYYDQVYFQIALVDPTAEHKPIRRSPIATPSVCLEGHTLLFATPCDGCTLKLINQDGDVEYTTVIPTGTQTLVLPSHLSGDYCIQIIRGRFCFWGYIVL